MVSTGVSPKPRLEWNTGKLSKEEKETLSPANDLELADETMDPGYIQHNPNVPQGRDEFKQFMSRIPGRRPEDPKPIQAAWINPPALTRTDGPYSLMM